MLYAYLKEVNKGNNKLTNDDLGISLEEFYDIIRFAHAERYVNGVFYASNIPYFTGGIKITMKGIEFLEQNNAFAKAYRNIKEIRDWVKS